MLIWLYVKFGFVEVGWMGCVGYKFGCDFGIVYMC